MESIISSYLLHFSFYTNKTCQRFDKSREKIIEFLFLVTKISFCFIFSINSFSFYTVICNHKPIHICNTLNSRIFHVDSVSKVSFIPRQKPFYFPYFFK